VIDCSCGGYVQEGMYVEAIGAREAYLQHLVDSTAVSWGWPETFTVRTP
jgi:hypothetical protein